MLASKRVQACHRQAPRVHQLALASYVLSHQAFVLMPMHTQRHYIAKVLQLCQRVTGPLVHARPGRRCRRQRAGWRVWSGRPPYRSVGAVCGASTQSKADGWCVILVLTRRTAQGPWQWGSRCQFGTSKERRTATMKQDIFLADARARSRARDANERELVRLSQQNVVGHLAPPLLDELIIVAEGVEDLDQQVAVGVLVPRLGAAHDE